MVAFVMGRHSQIEKTVMLSDVSQKTVRCEPMNNVLDEPTNGHLSTETE